MKASASRHASATNPEKPRTAAKSRPPTLRPDEEWRVILDPRVDGTAVIRVDAGSCLGGKRQAMAGAALTSSGPPRRIFSELYASIVARGL